MKQADSKKIAYLLLNEAGIGVILVLLCVVFSLFVPNFAQRTNISNIFTQISINTVIAVGMTFVILLGGIDLSVGSVLALCTILAGFIITDERFPLGAGVLLAVLAAVGAGMACGLFTGVVCELWRIHPFVVTLGMLNMARGGVLHISNSRTIYSFPKEFNAVGTLSYFDIPLIFIVAVLLVLLGHFILKKTVFGRMMYAIGNNEEAVRLSGHNTKVFKVIERDIFKAS